MESLISCHLFRSRPTGRMDQVSLLHGGAEGVAPTTPHLTIPVWELAKICQQTVGTKHLKLLVAICNLRLLAPLQHCYFTYRIFQTSFNRAQQKNDLNLRKQVLLLNDEANAD
jgi:hypothetical protein